jgi:predicted signal transduction protein with EAL and GGDEF domain
MEKAFYGDFCQWPDEIQVNVSAALKTRLEALYDMMHGTDICSASIDVPADFISAKTAEELRAALHYDVERIIAHRGGFAVYYIQGKYDSRIQAEYAFNDCAMKG